MASECVVVLRSWVWPVNEGQWVWSVSEGLMGVATECGVVMLPLRVLGVASE